MSKKRLYELIAKYKIGRAIRIPRLEITQEIVREIFDYDRETGNLIWKITALKSLRNTVAGTMEPNGYRRVMIFRNSYAVSNIVWLYHYGELPVNDIDHINRIRNDDRIENLRELTRSKNNGNTINPRDNTSGVKGVYHHSKMPAWCAQIGVGGKRKFLGYSCDFDEAVCLRLAAEQCMDWVGIEMFSPAYKHVKEKIQTKQEAL